VYRWFFGYVLSEQYVAILKQASETVILKALRGGTNTHFILEFKRLSNRPLSTTRPFSK
jgi:hypothetical protein